MFQNKVPIPPARILNRAISNLLTERSGPVCVGASRGSAPETRRTSRVDPGVVFLITFDPHKNYHHRRRVLIAGPRGFTGASWVCSARSLLLDITNRLADFHFYARLYLPEKKTQDGT